MSARLIEENLGHRAALARSAVLWTPLAVLTLTFTAFLLAQLLAGNAGALIGLVLTGAMSFALTYEAVAALRDLRAAPVTTRGPVLRVWSKHKVLLFGNTFYVQVDRDIFTVTPQSFHELYGREGVEVEARHWPHTNTIITLHLLGQEGEREKPERPREQRGRRTSVPPPPAP